MVLDQVSKTSWTEPSIWARLMGYLAGLKSEKGGIVNTGYAAFTNVCLYNIWNM